MASWHGTIDDHAKLRPQREPARGQCSIKLYLDKDSGLLLRVARYSNTAVGEIPTRVDYSDYRAVSGIKMPFKWIVTWADGQSTTELSAKCS